MSRNQTNLDYGFSNALQRIFPAPTTSTRDPNPNDNRGQLGSMWVNTLTQGVFILTSFNSGLAVWTGVTGTAAVTYTTDAGNANPAGGILNILGDGVNVGTSGAGNTVTITDSLTPVFNTVTAQEFLALGTGAGTTGFTLGIMSPGVGTFTGSENIMTQNAVQTVDATPTVLVSVPVAAGRMVIIDGYLNGMRNNFSDAISSRFLISVFRPGAGNVTLTGAPVISTITNAAGAGFGVAGAIDVGTQTARVVITGIAAQTWNWVATYNYMFTITNA